MEKKRIDVLLVEQGFFDSREKAKRAIMAVVIFFIPDLVNLVFTFVASDEARQCIKDFK